MGKLKPYARIVVEGMDGSGKTTLTRTLLSVYDGVAEYQKSVGPRENLPDWWMDQLNKNNTGDKVILHDRFFYPELVYGPILRGKINVDKVKIEYIQNFLRANAFLIYCRPRITTMAMGIKVEKQWPGVQQHFSELLSAYDEVMSGESDYYEDRFFKYDWEDDTALTRLIQSLSRYMFQ